MKIIRKRLWEGEIVNPSLIYDPDCDCVKQTFDGGLTFVDAPDSDPRTAPQFRKPPVVAADPQCQAAANFEANINNALNQMGVILASATTAEGMLTVVVGAVSAFFPPAASVGTLALLALDAATVLFDAGLTAVTAAFSPANLNKIKCAYLANASSDGTMNATGLSGLLTDVGGDPGGLASTTLSALFAFGGVNLATNMGATGAADADCASCTGWCWQSDGTTNLGDWAVATEFAFVGSYDGTKWNSECDIIGPNSWETLGIEWIFSPAATLTRVLANMQTTVGTDHGTIPQAIQLYNAGVLVATTNRHTEGGATTIEWTGTQICDKLVVLSYASESDCSGSTSISLVKMDGTGDSPFGSSNC